MKLKEQFDCWIKYKNYSQNTGDAYWSWIKDFIKFNGTLHPKELTGKINDYLIHLRIDKNLAPKTIKQAGCALIFLYKNILKLEIPYIELPRPHNRKLPAILTREEVPAILRHVDQVASLGVKLCYACGMRVGEVCRLRVKDIDFTLGQIIVSEGKGFKDRLVNLPASLIPELQLQIDKAELQYKQDLAHNFNGTHLPGAVQNKYPSLAKSLGWQFLFSSRLINGVRYHTSESTFQKAFYYALHKSGVNKKVSVHSLRHAYATHQLQAGTDIRTVQELLGHKSLRTTMIYTHVLDTTKRQVVDLLEGKQTIPRIINIAG